MNEASDDELDEVLIDRAHLACRTKPDGGTDDYDPTLPKPYITDRMKDLTDFYTYSFNFNYSTPTTMSSLQSEIDDGRPFIFSTTGNSIFDPNPDPEHPHWHSVCARGYDITDYPDYQYIIVNDTLPGLYELYPISIEWGDWSACTKATVVPPQFKPGDANHNGEVDMGDVTKVERIILGLDNPVTEADANSSSVIDMGDVVAIELTIMEVPLFEYESGESKSGGGKLLDDNITVSIEAPSELFKDSDFIANVSISQLTGLDADNFNVTFNPAVIRLDDVTNGLIDSTTMPVDGYHQVSVGNFSVVQNLSGVTGVTGSGTLASLHFHVIGTAGQTSNIALSNGCLADTDSNGIPADWTGDSVTVIIPAPTGISATDGTPSDKVQVSWTASTGATGYKVFRNTSNNSAGASQIGTSATSPYDDYTADPGVMYWYWVKGYDATGESTFSSSDSGYRINPLTVTINQSAGQSDPTSASPVNFAVVFSEPVSDFAAGDVTLSGTAGATTATVTGSETTYNVAASGMTASGTVIASIAAGAAHDMCSNANAASTSTDNTVTYQLPPVVVLTIGCN